MYQIDFGHFHTYPFPYLNPGSCWNLIFPKPPPSFKFPSCVWPTELTRAPFTSVYMGSSHLLEYGQFISGISSSNHWLQPITPGKAGPRDPSHILYLWCTVEPTLGQTIRAAVSSWVPGSQCLKPSLCCASTLPLTLRILPPPFFVIWTGRSWAPEGTYNYCLAKC